MQKWQPSIYLYKNTVVQHGHFLARTQLTSILGGCTILLGQLFQNVRHWGFILLLHPRNFNERITKTVGPWEKWYLLSNTACHFVYLVEADI